MYFTLPAQCSFLLHTYKEVIKCDTSYKDFNLSLCLYICLCPELENQEARVTEIHALVHRLPEKNRQMLELLMKHLAT